ncbi:unnamed protein product [Caenorhabditis nigoni]
MEEIKQVYMGKTVPEMIAELERHERYFGRFRRNIVFKIFAKQVKETKKRHHKMNQRQRIEDYELFRTIACFLASPPHVTNYKDMSYEELVKLYCSHEKRVKERKSMRCQYPWERTPSEFHIKKTFINVCNNMSNRVKTAVTGTLESMKKRIGKKNKEEEK